MTHRLVRLASDNWPAFDGSLAAQGIDPMDLPFDRFLNLVYWWATQHAQDQGEIDKFDRRLWMPPKGVAPPKGSPWSPEAETAAFSALAAQVGQA